MASSEAALPGGPARKGGLIGLLVPVVVLTIIAAGGGGLIGTQIVAAMKQAPPVAAKAAEAPTPAEDASTALKELTPIVTNLASPDEASWIRLQAAVVYNKADAAQIDVISAKIGEDILALVRTMTLAQLQGATGLELLNEDLNERASIRSDGHVRELVIEMLVVQ